MGKVTISSSLVVTMAVAGHKVALIATDPAHRLGDAVAMDSKGGKMQDCSLVGVPNNTDEGSLLPLTEVHGHLFNIQASSISVLILIRDEQIQI